MPEPPSADARVRTALVSDTVGAAHLLETLSTLDQSTRADLLGRYEAYRPGTGDEIAARLRRLDGAIQREVISTLRDPSVGVMVPAATGLQVGMDEGATLQC